MPAVQGVWYYCLAGLVCFFFFSHPPQPPHFFLCLSVTANKRTHRPVSTTCTAHCHCCALTRQARHCVLWGLAGYCARCEKGSPAVPAPAPLVPILNRAIVFLNRLQAEPSRIERTQMRGHIHDRTQTHVHTHTHARLCPSEATSVRSLLRLQRKRWVQVKPNVCQMLR